MDDITKQRIKEKYIYKSVESSVDSYINERDKCGVIFTKEQIQEISGYSDLIIELLEDLGYWAYSN